jgi:hypothetical protein
VNIAVAGLSREWSFGGSKASATYTFSIFDGVVKTRAEVILADGGFEIIEQRGKDAEAAAKLALERLLLERCAHLERPIFIRISYPHAEYFSKYGYFHQSFR